MLKIFAILTALSLALAGCARGPTDAMVTKAHASCNSVGGYVARAKCLQRAELRVYSEGGHRHLDLVQLQGAYRLALAEKKEAGEITPGEADTMFYEMQARLNNEMQARQSRGTQDRAQRYAALGALLSGLGQWNASFRPAQYGAVNCFQTATGVTCH